MKRNRTALKTSASGAAATFSTAPTCGAAARLRCAPRRSSVHCRGHNTCLTVSMEAGSRGAAAAAAAGNSTTAEHGASSFALAEGTGRHGAVRWCKDFVAPARHKPGVPAERGARAAARADASTSGRPNAPAGVARRKEEGRHGEESPRASLPPPPRCDRATAHQASALRPARVLRCGWEPRPTACTARPRAGAAGPREGVAGARSPDSFLEAARGAAAARRTSGCPDGACARQGTPDEGGARASAVAVAQAGAKGCALVFAGATEPAPRAAQRPPRGAHLYRAGECARGPEDTMYEVRGPFGNDTLSCEPANAHPAGRQRGSNAARTPRRAHVLLTRRGGGTADVTGGAWSLPLNRLRWALGAAPPPVGSAASAAG